MNVVSVVESCPSRKLIQLASGYFPSWLYPEDADNVNVKPNVSEINVLNGLRDGNKRFKQSVYRLLNLNECWGDDISRPVHPGCCHARHIEGINDNTSVHSDSNEAYMKLTTKHAQPNSSSGTDSGAGLSERESTIKQLETNDGHNDANYRSSANQFDSTDCCHCTHPSYYQNHASVKESKVCPIQSLDIIDGELHRVDYKPKTSLDASSTTASRAPRCVLIKYETFVSYML